MLVDEIGTDQDDTPYGNQLKKDADTLAGGLGNDTYHLDQVGDVIYEDGPLSDTDDLVYSSISCVLDHGLDHLHLTGTAVSGTGNALDNEIYGNATNNTLDGGAGVDWLAGGAGNDTYYVDHSDDNLG